MQKANLSFASEDTHGKITKQTVELHGVAVTRITFNPGAKWSQDLKKYAGTASCQLPSVAVILSGALAVVMDDGSEEVFKKNETVMLPPGHDAWCVGDEAVVFVEFSRRNDYDSDRNK